MSMYLGDQFFRAVRSSPIQHKHAGRALTIEGHGPDLLRVREAGTTLAYITRYSESESGILRADDPKDILAPLFYTLEDALDSLGLR